MTKNVVIFSFIAILMLGVVGCLPAAPRVPEGAMPVHKMVEDLNGRVLNKIKVVEYHSAWVLFEVNGVPMVLTPDSKKKENTIYWLTPSQVDGEPAFGRMNLFNQELWDWVKENDHELIFYVFRNDLIGLYDDDVESLVFASEKDVHWVSAQKWEGTRATLVTWEYPLITPIVVHNMDTNEDAFMGFVYAEDAKGNTFDLRNGQAIWGYVQYYPAGDVSMDGIKVREVQK